MDNCRELYEWRVAESYMDHGATRLFNFESFLPTFFVNAINIKLPKYISIFRVSFWLDDYRGMKVSLEGHLHVATLCQIQLLCNTWLQSVMNRCWLHYWLCIQPVCSQQEQLVLFRLAISTGIWCWSRVNAISPGVCHSVDLLWSGNSVIDSVCILVSSSWENCYTSRLCPWFWLDQESRDLNSIG